MNNRTSFRTIWGFLTVLLLPLQSHTIERSVPVDPSIILEDQLRTEFSKPNKWNYKILWLFGPYISPNGLTYNISFHAQLTGIRLTSIEEAEELHAKIYETNLQIANSFRPVRPFLGEFPLTPNTFQISIGLRDERGNQLAPPLLASVIMDRQKLEFIRNLLNKSLLNPFEIVLTKQICDSARLEPCFRQGIIRSKAKVPSQMPLYTAPPERRSNSYGKALFSLSKEITAQNDLNLTALANVCGYTNSSTPFEIAFWGHHTLLLPDARKLTAQVSSRLLRFVRSNAEALKWLQTWKEHNPDTVFTDIATPLNIALRLSFWDDNIDRQPEPYVAEVRLRDGKVTYYTADEKQFLKQAFEESFEDAQKILEPQQDSEAAESR